MHRYLVLADCDRSGNLDRARTVNSRINGVSVKGLLIGDFADPQAADALARAVKASGYQGVRVLDLQRVLVYGASAEV